MSHGIANTRALMSALYSLMGEQMVYVTNDIEDMGLGQAPYHWHQLCLLLQKGADRYYETLMDALVAGGHAVDDKGKAGRFVYLRASSEGHRIYATPGLKGNALDISVQLDGEVLAMMTIPVCWHGDIDGDIDLWLDATEKVYELLGFGRSK